MNDLSSSNYVFYNAGKSGSGITVNIGANVTKIPAYLFYPYGSSYTPKITNVKFADNSQCKSIGDNAFYVCTGLTSIVIPNSVTSIGSDAFDECHKLVEVYNLSSSINGAVGYYALDVYTDANAESKLSNLNGYILYNNGTDRYLIGYTGSDTNLTLPENIGGENYSIYEYAFYWNEKITSITIPNSVTSIGSYAFRGCTGLTSITIPNSVTSIGYAAFALCTGLKEVHISDIAAWCNISFYDSSSNPLYYAKKLYLNDTLITDLVIPEGVTSIGSFAFAWCTGLTSVTIPDSVTSIGYEAFYGCTGLTSISIPDSVTSIGSYAFSYCTGLTSINFLGTQEQWNAITKGTSWDYNTGDYKIISVIDAPEMSLTECPEECS